MTHRLLPRALLLAVFLLAPQAKAQTQPGFLAPNPNVHDLTVHVIDAATRKPVGGASVQAVLTASDGTVTSGSSNVTSPDGVASLAVDPHLTYSLDIAAQGYTTLRQQWKPAQPLPPVALTPDANGGNQGGLSSDQSGEQTGDQSSGQSSGQTAEKPVPVSQQIKAALVALFFTLLPVFTFFLLREITVQAVQRLMMRRGSVTRAEPSPPPVAVTVTPPPPPTFLEINTLNGLLLTGPAQGRVVRAETTSRRKLNILLLSLVVQVCALAAVLALYYAENRATFDDALLPIGIGMGALLVVDLLIAFYAWTTWLQGARIVEVFALVSLVVSAAIAIVALKFHLPFYILFVPILQAAYVVQQGRRLRAEASLDGNRKLVILRVFGSDKNAAFTFGGLMSKWRFIGSFLTIVDPAYLRYQFTLFGRGKTGQSLGVFLTFGTLTTLLDTLVDQLPQMLPPGVLPPSWTALPAAVLQSRLHALVYAVVTVAAIGPILLYLSRRFLKSPAQAVAQVDRVREARLGLESDFYGSPLFCFDDVWKPAVHRMLDVADAVLMDLRGFSAERQGCAYEIGELVDTFPVGRLLFLVDATTPRDLLYSLILERWAAMPATSPNRDHGQSVIQIYQSVEFSNKSSRQDIHNLVALLSLSLESTASQITVWQTRPATHSAAA